MEMDQAQLVYCSFEIDCQCFYFFYKGDLIFCFSWMTKGMSQLETTGPAWADYLGWSRSRQSVLQSYWRRLSCHLMLSVVVRLPSLQGEIKLHLLSR
ncbi:hypothetical protein V6N11_051056 [Hibiscus sabdariffa]|uniref:Uncharacterized protein n=1 Tax=Hibiscus sabdariffa TaxID=183260 RepID=A0ABR2R2Q1_9ROSI